MKIGIILMSVREGRIGDQVANWLFEVAKENVGVDYELVDMKQYSLPILGTAMTAAEGTVVTKFKKKMGEYDGYIYVTPEYNRSIPGAWKNASDYLGKEVYHKPVAFVGYGALGAARAIENHRSNVSQLFMLPLGENINFLLYVDFVNNKLKAQKYHVDGAKELLLAIERIAKALKNA